jgi:hypothetical protein
MMAGNQLNARSNNGRKALSKTTIALSAAICSQYHLFRISREQAMPRRHIHTNYRRKSTITSSGHQRPPIQCLLLTQSGHERLRIAALRDVDRDPLGLPFRATSCSGRVNSSGGLEKFTAHDLSGSALVWAPIIRVEP